MRLFSSTDVWLGDESCFIALAKRVDHFLNSEASLRRPSEDEENPVGYEVKDGVAVISVVGGTLSNSNWITRILGIPSYEDIKERFGEALSDGSVSQIALFLDTPGGMAKGVKSLSNYISKASKVKEVTTYNEGSMASAGLWYGTASSQVVADEDSRTGSLGAIAVHSSYVRMRKEMGIDDTVMRTAENKALGHPLEELSDKAKAKIMEELNTLHNQFVSGVALNRTLEQSHVQEKIATGDMFDSTKAKKLGLIDRVDSAEGLLYSLTKKAAKGSSASGKSVKLSEEPEMAGKKNILSAAVLAALASGVPEAEALNADKSEESLKGVEEGKESLSSEAEKEQEENKSLEKEEETVNKEEQLSNKEKSSETVVEFLKASLVEAQNAQLKLTADLTTANAKLSELEKNLEESKNLENSLKDSLAKVAIRFASACSMSVPDLKEADTKTVLACFEAANTAILSRFSLGQAAKTTGELEKPKSDSKPVPRASKAVSLGSSK